MIVLCAFSGSRIWLPKRLPIVAALPRIQPFLENCIMVVEVGKCSIDRGIGVFFFFSFLPHWDAI